MAITITDVVNDSIDSAADYTAESVASTFIKKGVLPEHIIFKPKGTSKRSYIKDVSAIYTTINEETNSSFLFLESPREGIYDTLPEPIFHAFNGTHAVKNKESIKEEIKKHREEEKQARLFFLPFEQEFFNIRRILFSFEDEFDWLSNASSLIGIYNTCYPILNDLTVEKAYLFLRLIPLIHDIRDDFPKIEECLSILLDAKVEITRTFKTRDLSNYALPGLGFATLGTDTIMGSSIEDGEPDLSITIKPDKKLQVEDYSFFENKIQLTKQLCDFFLGAQYDQTIFYTLDSYNNTLSLNETSILGYNVYL